MRYDNIKAFTVCTKNLQYIWTLKNSTDETLHGKLLQLLVSDEVKNHFLSITAENADLNFDKIRSGLNKCFPTNALITWEDELKNLTKKCFPETVKKNLQILEDYIKLCLENGAKPIGVMFPFAPMMHDNYNQELLTYFRLAINQLKKIYPFQFIDLFDLKLDYSHFWNMAHLNIKGSMVASSILSVTLHSQDLLPFENLCKMNYSFFDNLSHHIAKNDYNALMDRVFKVSVAKIRQKKKIKVAFVSDDASMWCGDDLYNYFAQNEHYEPTVFLCLRSVHKNFKTVVEEFNHGIEQFKSRNINVVGLKDPDSDFPHQDVIIFLRPYLDLYGKNLQLNVIPAETLMIYIPYAIETGSYFGGIKIPLIRTAWQIFFPIKFMIDFYDKNSEVGVPRNFYSGYPKLDSFFKEKKSFKFEWKMAVPNAKKIIWAPHWSINGGVNYATFQWNYQFMYELAKRYPQISWVVKPHPHLLHSAVENRIFPNTDAFKEYFQKWDELPNAKVETGAYYQDIFATSDGMILDSGSFISEYQYTHKPMIYLTRDTQKFNEFGNAVMKVLYRVDGKDFNAIAALIQKVFIEGNDELFDARLKFFDKYFNYQKANGMLASEFIFKKINDELN